MSATDQQPAAPTGFVMAWTPSVPRAARADRFGCLVGASTTGAVADDHKNVCARNYELLLTSPTGCASASTANDPVEQEKDVKFTSLLANLVIFHNTVDIADVVREMQAGGRPVDPLERAQVSPYRPSTSNGSASTPPTNSASPPDDYDARLNVHFSVLGDDDKAASSVTDKPTGTIPDRSRRTSLPEPRPALHAPHTFSHGTSKRSETA
ncbi:MULTISPECIES: Tn3 family transposase [unclassified Streptomyces]|uniref:Tn3 family transposase n=1 Tax=unclassified Streptomyces TaxID=2593676 RepID=UPI003646F6A1